MPVPSAITDLSTTPASNSPSGSESITTSDDYLRTLGSFIRQNYNRMTDGTGAIVAASFTGAHNGSVGATTPSTGAFTTLSASGTASANAALFGVSGTQDVFAFAGRAAGTGPLLTSQNYNATSYAPLTITGSSFVWQANGATTVLSVTTSGLAVTGTVSATNGTIVAPVAFASLPASPVAGQRAMINNSVAAPAFLSAAAGGGATTVPVFYNGSAWLVG